MLVVRLAGTIIPKPLVYSIYDLLFTPQISVFASAPLALKNFDLVGVVRNRDLERLTGRRVVGERSL